MICWNAACIFRIARSWISEISHAGVKRPESSFAAKGGYSLLNAVSTRTQKILRQIREMIFENRCPTEGEFFRLRVADSFFEIHSPVAREMLRDRRIFFVIPVLDLKRTLW
jgi:hypothetical protein